MGKGNKKPHNTVYFPPKPANKTLMEPLVTSFLDKMEQGREYESIVGLKNVNVSIDREIKRVIEEISSIRKHPLICYVANVLNSSLSQSIAIDDSDQLPFSEMIQNIPSEKKEIDIILVTPGGTAETVDFLVKELRKRFDRVSFILPYMAMSAGTIFCMSGNELIMTENAFFGPIDPQVPSKNGRFVPAQSIFTLIEDIKVRGEEQLKKGLQPDWTDIQILRNLDAREIGNAINASKLSTDLVTKYLEQYKFKDWTTHRRHESTVVTDEDRHQRATKIATQLCDHSIWLSHSTRINRDMAWETCELEIKHPEDIEGLNNAIKRFWALMAVFMERSPVIKVFASQNYLLFRNEVRK